MARGVPGSAEHGGTGSLYNTGCRCEPCVLGHRARMAKSRKERRASRVWIEGHLVAVKARFHGTASTYQNWGCGCPPCLEAGREKNRSLHEKMRKRRYDEARRLQRAGVTPLVEQQRE